MKKTKILKRPLVIFLVLVMAVSLVSVNGYIPRVEAALSYIGNDLTSAAENIAVLSIKEEEDFNLPFMDVSEDYWAYSSIAACYNNGWILGTTLTTFSPDDTVTRAQFMTILGRYDNADISSYISSKFVDVSFSSWGYAPYVAWAEANGIAHGTDFTHFSPFSLLTRAQIMVFLSNYVKYAGVELEVVNPDIEFSDYNSIPSYAREAVMEMAQAGVISGDSDEFAPNSPCSRAMVADCLVRFDKSLNGKHEEPEESLEVSEQTTQESIQESYVKVSKAGDVITIRGEKAEYVFKKIAKDTIRIDTWRLYRGDLVDDSGNLHNMWVNSDAEGVVKISGEDDFIGGYHGDEIMTDIKIYADNVAIDLLNDFEELNCERFEIFVSSDVYHCNTSDVSDDIAFTRNKKLVFTYDTVDISNYWVAQEDVIVAQAPLALFQCFKSDNGSVDEADRILNAFSCNTDLKTYEVVLGGAGSVPAASSKFTEFTFYSTYGNIIVTNICTSGQYYKAFVVDYSGQNRVKCYANTIAGDTNLSIGEVLYGRFTITIK